jgi:ethanolamine ammonia-lyase large subunit
VAAPTASAARCAAAAIAEPKPSALADLLLKELIAHQLVPDEDDEVTRGLINVRAQNVGLAWDSRFTETAGPGAGK